MDIKELVLHDSVILQVTENPLTDYLSFLIDWCNESGDGPYVKAVLIFKDVLNYEVHEGAFQGNPTILEVNEIGERVDYKVVRKKYQIETNAGFRSLYCKDIEIKSN